MNKIKWGIVSTGRIANDFASDFRYVVKGELHAVASRGLEKARDFAGKYNIPKYYGSYEELFADQEVDVVYVATPHNFHLENSIAALRAGKAVLCEKPITTNAADFGKLEQVAKDSGNYLMEGLWTYFLPATIQSKNWVDANRIGVIKHMKLDFGFAAPFDPEGRLFNPELAGGGLLDIGIYTLAIPWLLTHEKPKILNVEAQMASTGVDEEVLVDMKHGGCRTSVHFSLKYTTPREATIIGEKGYIRIKDFFRAGECYLHNAEGELIDQFNDHREGVGFNYEIDAVNEDLISGKKSSDQMPLRFSKELQEQMDQIRALF